MLLITGASGFVGRHLLARLQCHSPAIDAVECSILSLYHREEIPGAMCLDLLNSVAVNSLFRSHDISGVIHLAAEARPAECEKVPERAWMTNVDATRNLLSAASATSPFFLYLSTDMVFNGDRGNYTEKDPSDSRCVYGQTKAAAEVLVQQYAGPSCIIRPALIYGPDIVTRTSSLGWTLRTIASGSGHFFTDEIRTPVYIQDLVSVILEVWKRKHSGTLHVGGPETLSRYEFAMEVSDACGLPSSMVKPGTLGNDPVNGWRPRNLSLISEIVKELHNFTLLRDALDQMRNEGFLQCP